MGKNSYTLNVEACNNTAEGLTGHIALRVEDGEDIPLPTLLDQIRIEPDTRLAGTPGG